MPAPDQRTVLTTAVAVGIAYALTGFPVTTDYTALLRTGLFPDVIHERATAREALFGNPYRPFGEIVSDYGYAPPPVAGINARTPGALLLQLPLIMVPERLLLLVTVGVVLLQLAVALFLTRRILALDRWHAAAGPLFFASFPAVTAIMFGTATVLLVVDLTLLAWAFRGRRWAGVPLGIAAASRLWPALIAVGFWIEGRRAAAAQALAVFVIVTIAGLLLPSVTLAGTWDAMAGGADAWLTRNQNVSAVLVGFQLGVPATASVLVMSAVGVGLALATRRNAIAITAVAALLASPLSWPSYCIAALPSLVVLWRCNAVAPWAVAAPFLLWILIPTPAIGYTMCAALTALLGLTAINGRGVEDQNRGLSSADADAFH